MPVRLGRPVPALDQVLVFAILAGMVALLALLAAMVSEVIPPERAFAGSGDQAVVIIASALVPSAAVGKSGLFGRAARFARGAKVLPTVMKNRGALAIFRPIASPTSIPAVVPGIL